MDSQTPFRFILMLASPRNKGGAHEAWIMTGSTALHFPPSLSRKSESRENLQRNHIYPDG